MDTKFSAAVHVLILISESPTPINSDQMAVSVGTNRPVLSGMFASVEDAFACSLAGKTLADCIAEIRNKIK